MNTVQNGGVSDPPQTDIKKPPVQIRTISDYGPFKIYHEKSVDEHLFRHILVPGSFHYCQGDAKTGKTHLCVTLMYLLSTGFDNCGEWEIFTNIFFYHVDKDNIEPGTPERIHHIDSIEELFEAMLEHVGNGRKIAIFLDDIDKFFSEKPNQLTQCIDSLVQNRNKLQVLLFFSDGGEVGDYVHIPHAKYPSDCEWHRYKSQYWWMDTVQALDLNLDWNYIHVSSIEHLRKGSFEIYTGTTEWTDKKKDNGWTYDIYNYASVLRCSKAFDPQTFWKGIENIPSVLVWKYIREYTSHLKEEKSTKDAKSQYQEDMVSIAIRLKSMGLTDEAIGCALGIAKTTLRRWTEKAGYNWRVGEVDLPYRFKILRGKESSEPATPEIVQE